jgi:psp operon transcriptional activator
MNASFDHDSHDSGVSGIAHVEALGQSEAFLTFSDDLSLAATVNRPVLLLGERGTGKELAASSLHYLSPRWQTPLVTLNCGALTPTLIEAELFGHEKGAFTGADRRRSGRFEAADGGTLFLDEIGNLPPEVQAKLLRVVEYGVFERVGGTQPVEVDVRIVGATNADLGAMARDGRFRFDLLDRLAFEVLVVPPLRERIGDIELLADHFAAKMAVELGRPASPVFSPKARQQLLNYPWPGNIRELKNVVERATYRAVDGRIEQIDINPLDRFATPAIDLKAAPTLPTNRAVKKQPQAKTEGLSLDVAVGAVEVRMVKHALQQSKYNQKKAARILGISYDRLRGLIKKHGDRLEE